MGKNQNTVERETLEEIVKYINRARSIIGDGTVITLEKSLSADVAGVIGAVGGGLIDFLGIHGGGVVGTTAVGMTSGLKAIGKFFFGGMRRGLAAVTVIPTICCIGTYKLAEHINNKQLSQETERIYSEVIAVLELIDTALENDDITCGSEVSELRMLKRYLEQAKVMLRFFAGSETNTENAPALIDKEVMI